MNIITLKISEDELNSLKKYLIGNIVESNNENILLVFKYKNITITIYKSMKVVIQGKQCDSIYKELMDNKIFKTNLIIDDDQNDLKECNQKNVDTVGCDEVGVGDFFGGIVVSACYVNKDDVDYLINLGVKDSKKLTDKKMLELFPLIIKKVRYVTKYINPNEYNEFYEKYKNSHIIKTLLHNEALCELKEKYLKNKSFLVIMDEYCSRENYVKYINTIKPQNFVDVDLFKIKAESSYIAVACASIIARVYFLKQIEILNESLKKYNLSILLGNGEQVHNLAQTIYNINNKILDNLVKKHFITYNKIIGENHE